MKRETKAPKTEGVWAVIETRASGEQRVVWTAFNRKNLPVLTYGQQARRFVPANPRADAVVLAARKLVKHMDAIAARVEPSQDDLDLRAAVEALDAKKPKK